jgi:hypothetical protein
MENFSQLCVWEGTVVGVEEIENFEGWLQLEFGVRAKYCEEVLTLPTEGVEDTGGRNDLFFRIHDEDVMKFALPRLTIGIKWWEDVLGNGNGVLYPEQILEKYPKTW